MAADGKRYLVIHGDQFDLVVRHARWLALLGDGAYTLALFVNTHLNVVRRRLGLTYWSLSAWAKLKVKNAVNYIGASRSFCRPRPRGSGPTASSAAISITRRCTTRSASATLTPAIGSNPARRIVEHYDGSLELIRWADGRARQGRRRPAADAGEPADGVSGRLMRLLVATDAWRPQVNGVVRSLEAHGGGGAALRRRPSRS